MLFCWVLTIFQFHPFTPDLLRLLHTTILGIFQLRQLIHHIRIACIQLLQHLLRLVEFALIDVGGTQHNEQHLIIIAQSIVGHLVFARIGEMVPIDDADRTIILALELQRLIHILHLVIVRMRLAIWCNQTVDTERPVIRLVTEIPAVEEWIIIHFPFSIIHWIKSLIYPVPDGGTNDATVGIDHIPVFFQITTGITHRMGIFAHHKGLVADFLGLTTQVIGIEITVVPDGRVAAVAVVEGWASAVQLAYLIIHRLDVRSYAALVTKTPKNDARMVEVALHQRLSPVHMGLLEGQVFAHHLVGIAITVGFVVRLVHHVDTPTVTELVEVFAVRIVRGAQEIDVRLLHQSDVILVSGIIHIAACFRVVVVTVHTAQFHVFAVNLKHLAHNLHLLHTEVVVKRFVVLAILHAKQL